MFKVTLSNECSLMEAVALCKKQKEGNIYVPKGKWQTGPIHLISHMHIVLEEGAEIIFSDNPDDYLPVVFTRWEGTECYNYSPLIYAANCSDISIKGKGTLNGNGEKWWKWKKLQLKAAEKLNVAQIQGIPVRERIYGTKEDALRPSFIQFIECNDVLLDGFTITEGPQWTIHPVYCEDVIIRNIHVKTSGPNTDGLNPDSCQNVLIDSCVFETGDDCIAINSGLNEDGWRVNRPCQNIEIRNCEMNKGHGGIVIGSAISGGVSDIYAHDIKIENTMQGIRLKTMRGRGGYAKNISVENIELNHISNQAIHINMFYEFSTVIPNTTEPSDFDNIRISNVIGKENQIGIEIKGLPEKPINHLTLENIRLEAQKGFQCSDVNNLDISKVNILQGGSND